MDHNKNETFDVARVTEFYARQNQAIDEGDADAFAATYTADGSFHSATYGDPVVGAEALIQLAKGVHAELAAEGIQQRHWTNSVVVNEDARTARSYLMIIRTGPDGVSTVLRHVTVTDEFSFDDEGLLKVRARQVHREKVNSLEGLL